MSLEENTKLPKLRTQMGMWDDASVPLDLQSCIGDRDLIYPTNKEKNQRVERQMQVNTQI